MNCPAMCDSSSRITSNVVGWTMAFCGYVASRVTPSTWSPSVAPKVGALGERRGFCPSCGARRMSESAALLVDEVLPEQPMCQWVLSSPFQLRFLFASRPEIMGRVLGIVYRVIAMHLIKKAGHGHATARTGAVTLIQRFGGVLNLNIHFHMLFLDGVYVDHPNGTARFRWVKAPTSQELTQRVHTIAHRVGRFLEQQGLLERDAENSYLASDTVDDDPMNPLLGHFITYRIAVGPQAGPVIRHHRLLYQRLSTASQQRAQRVTRFGST